MAALVSSTSVLPDFHKFSQILHPKSSSQFSCPLERLGSRRASRRLAVRSASTKPAKSPVEEEWKNKRELLLEKRVRSVDVNEALRLQKENNFVILDVRPEAEFKEGHPPGAINIQIYRLIKEWTAWDIARRAAFLFFGIFSGTEENPEFMQTVESKLNKDSKIIVACSAGGTTKPSQNLPEGQQSRLWLKTRWLPMILVWQWLQITNSSLRVGSQWIQERLPLRRRALHMVQRGTACRI